MTTFTLTANPLVAIRDDGVEVRTDLPLYLEWIGDGGIPKPIPYQELRKAGYPPAADYLDAVVKGDEIAKQAYIDACLAVKAKYPKS